ncbi:proline-rich protein 15 [Tupaia chinensis]|nr:proline-rich protein 15 [Tupaia chinensis]
MPGEPWRTDHCTSRGDKAKVEAWSSKAQPGHQWRRRGGRPAWEKPGEGGENRRDREERETGAWRPFPTRAPRALADSGGTGGGGPWWKSLTNSRKKSKEVTAGAQLPGQPAPGEPVAASAPSPDTSSSQENQHPNPLGGAGEPHKPDKACAEKSANSRRNLKISRSGRFKEKRKARATMLPEGVQAPEEAGFPGDPREDMQ